MNQTRSAWWRESPFQSSPRVIVLLPLAVLAAAIVGMLSFSPAPTVGRPKPLTAPGGLKGVAARDKLLMGTAVSARNLSDPLFASTLIREYSSITPENEMKWAATEPEKGIYTYSAADSIVAFAKTNGMKVRGHTLVSGRFNPAWLTNENFSTAQLSSILHDHITNEVAHFKGQVYAWDVVNEPLASDGSLDRTNAWYQRLGPSYISLALKWAHATDPGAHLFINQDGIEGSNVKSDGLYRLVSNLKSHGVPIDGIGLESHFDVPTAPPPSSIVTNMRRFAALGIETPVTELDVRLHLPASGSDLERQASVYDATTSACLQVRSCTSVTTWGFTDRYSWIPGVFPGFGRALPFDEQYRGKPAYVDMRAALSAAPAGS